MFHPWLAILTISVFLQAAIFTPVWSYEMGNDAKRTSKSGSGITLLGFVEQKNQTPSEIRHPSQQIPQLEPDWFEKKLPAPEIEPEPGIVGLDLRVTPAAYPIVYDVFQGTPADFSDLRQGDEVVSVNGIPTLGKSSFEIDQMISDRPGEAILFTVLRHGQVQKRRLTVLPLSQLSEDLRALFTTSVPGLSP